MKTFREYLNEAEGGKSDLAKVLTSIKRKANSIVFNGTGPKKPLTLRDFHIIYESVKDDYIQFIIIPKKDEEAEKKTFQTGKAQDYKGEFFLEFWSMFGWNGAQEPKQLKVKGKGVMFNCNDSKIEKYAKEVESNNPFKDFPFPREVESVSVKGEHTPPGWIPNKAKWSAYVPILDVQGVREEDVAHHMKYPYPSDDPKIVYVSTRKYGLRITIKFK